MTLRRQLAAGVVAALLAPLLPAGQVIEFESGGLKYQTLTRRGLTIMFAHLPTQIREFAVIQVAVSNGSPEPVVIRPEDFQIETQSGEVIQAVPALYVINRLVRNASSNDVIKLVTTYEMGLYGLQRIRATNGYEQRRQAALAFTSSKKLKAAAAASAIAFVETELQPGDSTDGAIFYPTYNRPIGKATLRAYVDDRVFEFKPSDPAEIFPKKRR